MSLWDSNKQPSDLMPVALITTLLRLVFWSADWLIDCLTQTDELAWRRTFKASNQSTKQPGDWLTESLSLWLISWYAHDLCICLFTELYHAVSMIRGCAETPLTHRQCNTGLHESIAKQILRSTYKFGMMTCVMSIHGTAFFMLDGMRKSILNTKAHAEKTSWRWCPQMITCTPRE